jgi:hypothetical protein
MPHLAREPHEACSLLNLLEACSLPDLLEFTNHQDDET